MSSHRLFTDPTCWTPAYRHFVNRTKDNVGQCRTWEQVRERWIAVFGAVETSAGQGKSTHTIEAKLFGKLPRGRKTA